MVKGLLATSQFLRSTHPPILQKFSSLFSQELKTMSKTMMMAPFDEEDRPKTYVFAYAGGEESAKRRSQVEYFALTKDIPSGRIRCVEFTSLDDLCDQLLAVKTDTNMPIVDEFYLLVHGPGDGLLTVFDKCIKGDDLKTRARDFFFRGDVPVVTPHWIHCGSALMAPNGDAIANRIFGVSSKLPGSTVVFTPENDSGIASTWNIQTAGDGWMHTGLNPEILDDEGYRNFLLEKINQSHPEAKRVTFYGDRGNVHVM